MSELVLGPGGILIGAILSDCRVVFLAGAEESVTVLNCSFQNCTFEYDRDAAPYISASGCVFEGGCKGMEFAGFTRGPDGTAAFVL